MYPVEDVTGPGKVEPLNGLPGSSVADKYDKDWHEYTRTLHDLMLVNVRVRAVPGVEMVTEQPALSL
jgi:hypothetical protein